MTLIDKMKAVKLIESWYFWTPSYRMVYL